MKKAGLSALSSSKCDAHPPWDTSSPLCELWRCLCSRAVISSDSLARLQWCISSTILALRLCERWKENIFNRIFHFSLLLQLVCAHLSFLFHRVKNVYSSHHRHIIQKRNECTPRWWRDERCGKIHDDESTQNSLHVAWYGYSGRLALADFFSSEFTRMKLVHLHFDCFISTWNSIKLPISQQ